MLTDAGFFVKVVRPLRVDSRNAVVVNRVHPGFCRLGLGRWGWRLRWIIGWWVGRGD